MAHTATPWRLNYQNHLKISGSDDIGIATSNISPNRECTESESNAQHIVHCVNSHDALLAALENAIERMESVANSIPVANRSKGVSQATHAMHMAGHLAQHAKKARAALKQAKA